MQGKATPLPGVFRQAVHWVNHQAWLVLVLTTLIWSGNIVAGRLAVDQISPMALVTLRWFVACSLMAPLVAGELKRDLPALAANWKRVALMGTLGFTGYNALYYAGARYTTGVNLAILQSVTPIMVMIASTVLFRQSIRAPQWIGLALTVVGVATIAAQGELTSLAGLQMNKGDLWCLIACALFAFYSLALRDRPSVSPLSLFAAMAGAAFLVSLPLLAYEIAQGWFVAPTPTGWLLLAYVGVGPSFAAQLLYMRGVALIGPARAGVYYNLVPVFGAMLSVAILGEPFRLYHAAAMALVLAGIWIAERKG